MKPFSLKVEKFCRCMDLRTGMITIGVGSTVIWATSLSFGVLAATVEALNAAEKAGEGAAEGEVLDAALELQGGANTYSGFVTRSRFGFPVYHFAIMLLASITTFFSVFIRDNKQQQVCAIISALLYFIGTISVFAGWIFSISYASGCEYGDKKCGAVGVLCCFWYLLLGPFHWHCALVCNAWRERLGGRPLNDILFGDAPKQTARGAMIGKGTDMPNSQMPAPRPQLAVPASHFANNQSPRPQSQVGSVSQPQAGGLPPRGPPSMAPSGMSNFSNMQSQQQGLQHAATAGALGVSTNRVVLAESSNDQLMTV